MTKYYIGIVVTALLSAVSQLMLNISAKKKYKGKFFEYMNPWVIGSYGILALVLVANIYLMRFIPLKQAHVIAASTYIFLLLLSRVFLKEKITRKKFIGILTIMAGIVIFSLDFGI